MSDALSTGTISVADTRAALAAGAVSSAVPAGNSCVTVSVTSMPTVGITITPAVSAGSLAIEGSSDGRNFFALSAQASGSTTSALTTGGATFLRCNTSALTLIQVRAVTGTAFGNGPIAVSIDAASDAGLVTTIDGASGGGSGGGPATLAAGSVSAGAYVAGAAVDGWNVTEGSTTDAAVTTDATGSISARLRGLVNLIAARIPTLGSKTSAGSLPVVIASDQGAIPVTSTASGTTAVSAASLPLPTGASTSALQTTGNTSLATIATNTPAVGQAAMAASVPVAIANNQSAVPVSAASLPLPTGASQDGTDATGTTQLTGGVGIRGWLSGIYTKLAGTLTATLTGALPAGTNQIGHVIADTGSTTAVTGTVATSLASLPALAAGTNAIGSVVASVNDGTTLANNTASPDSGQGAQMVAGNRKSVAFTTTTIQAVGSTDISNYESVAVHITSQGTSSTITFQGSNDNTNWVSVSLANLGSTGTSVNAVAATTAAIVWAGNCPYQYFRLNVTGISAGTTAGTIVFKSIPFTPVSLAAATGQIGVWTVQPGNTVNTSPWLVNIEGQKATYSASITGLAAVAGDVFTLTGSGTKTVRITRALVSGAATAASDVDLAWVKRSAADTGGTSSTPTTVPHDSSDAAATATVLAYTAAPTPGTAVGTMFARKIVVPSLTSPAVGTANEERTFELRGERAIVLRGTTQVFALNIGTVPTGGAFDIDITWTEE